MSSHNPAKLKRAGRPRSFDETKALAQAMYVFWEKGFDGASLSDLTKAMGIKPASLYCVFGNKQELFNKALERYRVEQMGFIDKALREPTAYAVAERLLRDSAAFLTRSGLPPMCMTLQTLAASAEGIEIHNELILLRKAAQKALALRFARAKREHDLPKNIDPGSLARFITAVQQGMNMQSVNGATRRELLDLAKVALRVWECSSGSI